MADLLPNLVFEGFTYLLVLLLHIFLGSGNDIYTNYKKWLEDRIGLLSTLENDARNIPLLAEVKLDDNLVAYDDAKKDVQ